MINPLISQTIDKSGDMLKSLAIRIHKNPEQGLGEYKACKWQLDLLKKFGFAVKNPFSGLETAYFAKAGSGKPVFCFIAEYDALPEIGHACGHNLICAASIGAAKALYETLKKENLRGTVIVMGTPGEEGKGGKVKMMAGRAFKNIDAVIMGHPSFRTAIWKGFLSVSRFDVSFRGKASHASTAPEEGKNALDAVMLFFQGINAWRQHLPESSRIHGIVTSGGTAPNIVPDFTLCKFYVRAENDVILRGMEKRFRQIAEGAALMTGTSFEVSPEDEKYMAGMPNDPLNDEFYSAAKSLGMNPKIPERSGRASSDFGDISMIIPGTHVYFGITKNRIPLHSAEFAEAAGSASGLNAMLKAAKALAQVGYRFLTDEELRRKVKADFLRRKKCGLTTSGRIACLKKTI